MRYNSWILAIVFLCGFSAFSQEKYTKHIVSKGETISKIAEQYHIKTSAIYELNPDAKKGINYKSVLLIPNTGSKEQKNSADVVTNYPSKKHSVLPKETLYGIAKQYGVTVEEIQKINPTLGKSGLRNGQKINIPGTESDKKTVASVSEPIKNNQKTSVSAQANVIKEISEESIVREILPNETKYAIAREYGITVADLDKANPILETEALQIGQKITIPVKEENTTKTVVAKVEAKKEKAIVVENKIAAKTETAVNESEVIENKIVETTVIRKVLPKETKYGIAKEYGISVKELERQNPKIAKSLPVGYKLSIRSPKLVLTEEAKQAYARNNEPEFVGPSYNLKSFHGTDFLDQLVSTASENIGTRYRTGGTTKEGFDCSGLMCTTFGTFDIQLPRTSIEQSRYGVKVSNEEAQKGDLIFFKTNGRRQINHVGMVVDVIDGDIKFIHASVGGGVIISSIKERYYSKKVSQINRVL
ncbi:peptidoglycan endopeptidase [Flavobacterium degerlachei]|jgi:cell wall-associated NlpC family hydrolase|uniref:LysM domain-containing protein n=1 Tax=Flavobacterium degerlachei TaxID=229203 RepID=A0A1H2WXF4_9FLAO|nr:peptidoglycan endopeptidase [Flavobacterium degerlachei]SDW85363.1 LysM domain-containing protein [Flavobacterium degerlachei]